MDQNSSTIKFMQIRLIPFIALILVSLGFFLPVWFLIQRKHINSLNSEMKITIFPFAAAILLFIITLADYAVPYFFTADNINQIIDKTNMAINSLTSIIFVVQAFKIKNILIEHIQKTYTVEYPVSRKMVLFFHVLYLQYKFNRLSNPDYNEIETNGLKINASSE